MKYLNFTKKHHLKYIENLNFFNIQKNGILITFTKNLQILFHNRRITKMPEPKENEPCLYCKIEVVRQLGWAYYPLLRGYTHLKCCGMFELKKED